MGKCDCCFSEQVITYTLLGTLLTCVGAILIIILFPLETVEACGKDAANPFNDNVDDFIATRYRCNNGFAILEFTRGVTRSNCLSSPSELEDFLRDDASVQISNGSYVVRVPFSECLAVESLDFAEFTDNEFRTNEPDCSTECLAWIICTAVIGYIAFITLIISCTLCCYMSIAKLLL